MALNSMVHTSPGFFLVLTDKRENMIGIILYQLFPLCGIMCPDFDADLSRLAQLITGK